MYTAEEISELMSYSEYELEGNPELRKRVVEAARQVWNAGVYKPHCGDQSSTKSQPEQ